jgi:hypothetical protein
MFFFGFMDVTQRVTFVGRRFERLFHRPSRIDHRDQLDPQDKIDKVFRNVGQQT